MRFSRLKQLLKRWRGKERTRAVSWNGTILIEPVFKRF